MNLENCMSQARCNARRRRQAKMNNAHVTGPGVPRYKKPDMSVQAAKSARKLQAQRERMARGAKQ